MSQRTAWKSSMHTGAHQSGDKGVEHEGVKQREPFKVGGSMAIEREMKEALLWKNRATGSKEMG